MNFDLEKEYSPSLHTKRFQNFEKPNEEVLKNFLIVSGKATVLARQTYKCHSNIRYGGEGDNQLLDIYFKEREEGTPIFAYIHGGFWQELDKTTSGPLVHTLIEDSYRIILVDYNTCPLVTLEQMMGQITSFFNWLKNYADKTKAPKILLCGHSAGAHLSLQILKDEFLQSSRRLNLILHVYLISGLYDLRELWSLKNCNPDNILHLDAVKAAELSPLRWLYNSDLLKEYRKQGITFHILVAENDSERFKMQSQDFHKELNKLKINTVYKEFEGYDHFDIIEECANEKSAISTYIRKNL